MPDDIMTFSVTATRQGDSGSTASAKEATVELDTSLPGRLDAFNPVELLLASLAACIIKGIDRVAPTLGFTYTHVDVHLVAHRPATEARISEITYVITINTADTDKLELLHKNVQKFGTISNTVRPGTTLSGSIVAA